MSFSPFFFLRPLSFASLLLCALLLWGAPLTAQDPAPAPTTTPAPTSAPQGEATPATPAASPTTTQGIDIEVKGGATRELIKMAVPPTKVLGGAASSLATKVESLLRKDLELAGFFKVLPGDGLFFDPNAEGMEGDDINFANWANVGAQGLIKSGVALTPEGRVKLDLRLYLVTKGQRVALKYTPSSALTATSYQKEVHDFVNALLAYYTGQAGVFGTRIAYVRRSRNGLKQVWVTDMSGELTQAVTKNRAINLLPTWGNGAIFYTSYRDQNPDLWVYQGGSHRKLSGRRGQNSGASLCGGKLALTMSMGGENTDIYVIDPQTGKQISRLTDHWAIDTSPTWSPDCSKIAFVSGRSANPQIYVMNADGSGQKRLTFKGSYNTTPEWSPKGDEIVFTARDERDAFDIFTVDLGGALTRLTQDQGLNEQPSYSPDGRYIVFTSTRGGGKNLWLMTSDGQYQRQITTGGGYGSPSWEK